MGLNRDLDSVAAETADGDFDLPPSMLNGAVGAAKVAVKTDPKTGPFNDSSHLLHSNAILATGIGGFGVRADISALDALAVATASDWTQIDLRRQDFLPGGDNNFNRDGNWVGGRMPDSGDVAFVRLGGDVRLNDNAHVNDLVVEGTDLRTGRNALLVDRTTRVRELTAGDASRLLVQDDGFFQTRDLVVESGDLDMSGGRANMTDDLLVSQTGNITGNGIIEFADRLQNNGRIRPDNGNLTFVSANGKLDLDGSTEDGQIIAQHGDIIFDAELFDVFNGMLRIDSGRSIEFHHAWQVNSGATLDLNGGGGAFSPRARLKGAPITVRGGDINATGFVEFETSANFTGIASIQNTDELRIKGVVDFNSSELAVNGSGLVVFEGATTFDSAEITGRAKFLQHGDVTVNGPTSITAEYYDMDGDNLASWTVNNTTLEITADRIDKQPGNSFTGNITLNDSSLTINTSDRNWRIARNVILNSSNSRESSIRGRDFVIDSQVHVDGNAAFYARMDLNSTGEIFLADSSSELAIAGGTDIPNRLFGGRISGPAGSKISMPTGKVLSGRGVIGTNVDFPSGTELTATDGVLTLSGRIVSMGKIGTVGDSAVLNVSRPWSTSIADELVLDGGEVRGNTITNDGTTHGSGFIKSNQFINTGQLSSTGVLEIETIEPVRLGEKAGVVNAIDGDLLVRSSLASPFEGQLNIDASRLATFFAGFHLAQNGELNMTGKISAGALNGATNLDGRITIDGRANIDGSAGAPFRITNTATIQLEEDSLLRLNDSTIQAGVKIFGEGAIETIAGQKIVLEDGVIAPVAFSNRGTLSIAEGRGNASLRSITTQSDSTLLLDIQGSPESKEFDQLFIDENISIQGGILEIAVNEGGGNYSDPEEPGDADTFLLIDGPQSSPAHFDKFKYDGEFLTPTFQDANSQRTHVGKGLFRNIYTDSKSVRLTNYAAVPGDATGDGFFNSSDLIRVFQVGEFEDTIAGNSDWTDGDWNLDGDVDTGDFIVAFGAGFFEKPRVFAQAVPEPNCAAMIAFSLLFVGYLRRQ